MRMWLSVLVSIALGVVAPAQDFPAASPSDVGMDAVQLEELASFVKGLTDKGEVVGAELLVIKNDKTVLQRAFGWKDQGEKVAMEPNTIFCVRSMTKPVVGTAVEMLIDDKKLALSDRASKYLPSFDNDRSRAITVEMLLHHKSGLPLSGLLTRDISTVTSIRQVADWTGEKGPEFPPGSRVSYSDDGTDTLGAIVEVASGESLDAFVEERIFRPLGMKDAIPVVTVDHPKRPRIASNYAGSPGNWTRYWSAKDPPIFRTFLASQSLYCTTRDYARFLSLWKEKGRAGTERLVSMRSARRAHEPGALMNYPTGFAGLSVDYGELWMLYVDRTHADKPAVVAFGHGGSDGTFAYCFPELDLMVLYFTQSRGTLSGFAFETELQKLVVDPLLKTVRAAPVAYTDHELDALVGEYWNAEQERLVALTRRGSTLRAEFPGQANVELKPAQVRDRFVIPMAPSDMFEIERDESDAPRALIAHSKPPGEDGVVVRFEPLVADAGLPSVDELEALRKRNVDWEKLDSLGVCRITGKIDMPARKLSGTITSLASVASGFRTEIDLGTTQIRTAFDGERAWSSNSSTGTKELSGVELAQARLDHPLRRVASLRWFFPEIRVMKTVDIRGRKTYLVRVKPPESGPRSLYVDAETGLLLAEAFVPVVAGVGEIGVWIDYDDWREVGPIQLPHRVTLEYASPLIGTTTSVYEEIETNVVVVVPDAFQLDAKK